MNWQTFRLLNSDGQAYSRARYDSLAIKGRSFPNDGKMSWIELGELTNIWTLLKQNFAIMMFITRPQFYTDACIQVQ